MAVTARPAVSFRRHRFSDLSLSDLTELGTLDSDLALFLSAAVRSRKNIVVSGAMNSGKTTLLRALAAEISPRERIVTIEQAFELGLEAAQDRHPDMVAVRARPANVEGVGLISVADLVKRALRMTDRVIVGEVLGDEVLPMLNAMSQGRSGSMCTIHADSSAGVFRRIASYAVQAQERLPLEATNLLIAGAIHFVVHLDPEFRTETTLYEASPAHLGGCRRTVPTLVWVSIIFLRQLRVQRFVSSVREVVDAEGVQVVSNEVFRPGPNRRAVPSSPLRAETLGNSRSTAIARLPGTPPGFGNEGPVCHRQRTLFRPRSCWHQRVSCGTPTQEENVCRVRRARRRHVYGARVPPSSCCRALVGW